MSSNRDLDRDPEAGARLDACGLSLQRLIQLEDYARAGAIAFSRRQGPGTFLADWVIDDFVDRLLDGRRIRRAEGWIADHVRALGLDAGRRLVRVEPIDPMDSGATEPDPQVRIQRL